MSSTWWSKQGGTSSGGAVTNAPATSVPATTSAFSNLFAGKTTSTPAKPAAPPPQNIPAISSDTVLDILKNFRLEGTEDKYETSIVFAKCKNEMMGGEDGKHVALRWFRAAEGGKFEELHVSKPFYQPSVDDVDKRLCVQCYDLKDESSSRFAEYGPVVLDPKVTEAVFTPDAKVKARSTGNEEVEISRSNFPPSLIVIKKQHDGSAIEEVIPSWKIMPNEAKRVLLGDGRELEFASSFDRDVATLLVRSNPPRSKSSSVASLEDLDKIKHQEGLSGAVEKQLRDRIMELEAQLMAARARGGAAETGKALAEAQGLRRELDKAKTEVSSLSDQLNAYKKAKSDLEERLRSLEREIALSALKEQGQANLQRELDAAKDALNKAQAQAKAANERANKAEVALDEYDRSIPELEARAKRAEDKIADMEAKVAKAQAETERAVGRRNAAQQKADSLAKDLARMLKATPGGLEEVEATMRENTSLKHALDDLRSELKQTRAAYEAQIASGKVHSAKASTSISAASVLGGVSAAKVTSKTSQLETLANSLMSEVKAKDEVIETQAAEIARLTLRLQEIQKRGGKDRSGSVSN